MSDNSNNAGSRKPPVNSQTSTIKVSADWLIDVLTRVFAGHGMPQQDARQVAQCLVEADMRGIHSHGSSRINIYSERLKLGLVNPTPKIQVHQSASGTAILDGDNGMGAVVGHYAAHTVAQQAKQAGIAAIAIHNSNHFGIAAVYAETIVQAGCFALVCSNSPPTMAPHGGSEPVFGTNPIALGVPTAADGMLVTDMATSIVARGKIIRATYEKTTIPRDWALDAEGRHTTDPEAALAGVVLPFAGAKGSAIALFVDILAGVLTGANFGTHTPDLYRNLKDRSNIGHFMLAIDITRFQKTDSFYQRLSECLQMVHDCKAIDADEPVKLPGEIEATNRAKALAFGIALPEDVIHALKQECAELGIQFKLPEH